ncbi:MAG: SsrA-binding protein SmpB [Planctomycetes bacterium]|nr:SsrA-binding protein SmpB [Planctomycetota bacterium]
MGKRDDKPLEPTIENRRARFEYAIGETLEVGIALRGTEVKSVRDGHVSLAEGYVRASASPLELTLHSANIGEYGPAGPLGNGRQHAPTRVRALLAHKREILKLAKESQVKGMTIVPLKLYFKNGFAKLLIGVAKGKSKHDKRDTIKDREAKRDIDRAMTRKTRN